MKTFVQQGISVSTPILKWGDEVKLDLNKWIQQRFNNKEQEASDDVEASDDDEVSDDYEASDDDEAEPSHARS
uniref:Putative ovule protein n=1 Tax=Solanum chacoense TaxID=4108 RepID=A0A0V0GI38_SOLCH